MSLRKQTVILLAILFSIIQAHAQMQTEVATTRDSVKTTIGAPLALKAKNLTDSIINYGKLFLNTPYRYGSAGTSTFDCSGFTSYVYSNFGYNLQRSSADQAEQFPTVDKTQLKPGDLVFFNGRRRNSRVGHVGIVVAAKEDGEFDFIHASVHDGVTISNSKADYYLKRFVKAGRVINNDSLLKVVAVNTAVKRQEYVSAVPSQPVRKVIPAKYHYVKSGETLSQIAERYGMTVAQLKRKNNLKKDMLQLKQRLKIKDEEVIMSVEPVMANKISKQLQTDTTKISGAATVASVETSKSSATTHFVKKGESLFSIAQQYNLSVGALKELNGLTDGKIYVGQEIKLIRDENLADNQNNKALKSTTASAKSIKHKVLFGETLLSISKKYNVSIEDLKLSNGIQNGKILAGQELVISSAKMASVQSEGDQDKESKPVAIKQTHKVSSGETLASIAKKYNTTLDELKKLNNLENGKIFAGQTIRISEASQTESTTEVDNSLKSGQDKTLKPNIRKITHKVRSGESLFSISKLYNVTIDELKAFNQMTSPDLQQGQTLQIPIGESGSVSKKSGSAKMYITHKVGSGETLSSIALKYGCTIKQLKAWNNKSSDKLDIGDKLKVYPE